jgi:hypothetical protein
MILEGNEGLSISSVRKVVRIHESSNRIVAILKFPNIAVREKSSEFGIGSIVSKHKPSNKSS